MTRYICYISFICALLIASAGTAQAQRAEGTAPAGPNLRLIARSYGDSVVLRWGTTTHTAWKVAGSKGYIIERIAEKGPNGLPERTIITQKAIKPLTIDEWKARYAPEDTLAGAAVQALYGKAVVTSEDPFGAIYQTYTQQRTLHGFALLLADVAPRIADGLGLRFVDRTARRGESYVYRVYSLANDPDERIDTAFAVVDVEDAEPARSVASLTAVEDEKKIVLKWNLHEHITPFSGYFIERSLDGGRTFGRLSPMPYVPADNPDLEGEERGGEASYTVKLEENYRPVTYRVVGVDAFGELSPNSRAVTAMGRDRTAPRQPQMRKPVPTGGTSLEVAWEMENPDADLQNFIVERSPDIDGPYEQVSSSLPKDARRFVDRDVDTLPQQYYVVGAVDTAGNVRRSVPMLGMFPDSIAPGVPMALAGTIDSSGVVRLHWRANTERDLKGYRVFYANQQDHEFQQLTGDVADDTLFTDTLTLQTLSEEIYYKVVALDNNYNHSAFTATLTLKKPDVVAPAPPLVAEVAPSDRDVRLTWRPAFGSDVVEHTVYRRADGDSAWTVLARVKDRAVTSITDSTASASVLYEYSLTATDDDGNTSLRSNVASGRVYPSGRHAGVGGVTATLDREHNRIVVRWQYPASAGDAFYIYKAGEGGKLSLVRSVTGGTQEFADPEVFKGNSYRYGVKVVAQGGAESPLTSTDVVEYK